MTTPCTIRPAPRLRHATLNDQLAREDAAEDAQRLSPDDRTTCPLHRRWIHQCVASPVHVNAITRHRWCRRCAVPLTVTVDEVTRTVTMVCPACGDGGSPATARLVVACRASLGFAPVSTY
ncbi:hypothetical protein [Rhodococcus koreensis]|jgi:hypothetical protein|uniref:Uncharacterized protein n=1 Tax=Rhodococcus koreensis TaxID=99653 RepID=A0A1H4VPK9_9NOCA|nr:hypothetical protein [Rhodococcus koreensis]QSE81124.1 hypothetical protein JWS14_19245 [Rhodococcus koreensis]SEC82883.1 hypothetical protein SAMN04490239_5620 [Rhodococcus koreensis]